uniref:Uncharacterized protein n=1 Tax=Cannabis sativa TaxID=3483 RepID=A0A803NHT7_CANSA
MCGVLGHQRRGCSLASPVMIMNSEDKPVPLFGPWLSPSSAYGDMFSGFEPVMARGLMAPSQNFKARASPHSQAVDGRRGGDRSKPPGFSSSRRFHLSLKTIARSLVDAATVEALQVAWLPMASSEHPVHGLPFPSNKVVGSQVVGGNVFESIPILVSEGLNASKNELILNLVNGDPIVVDHGHHEIGPLAFIGPVTNSIGVVGPHGTNNNWASMFVGGPDLARAATKHSTCSF